MQEIEQRTNHSSTSFWKKRYTAKQLLVIAVIGACLAIFSQMVRDAKRVLVDELWEEQGYAYPVKTEFVTSYYAGGVRNWLLQKGWDLDNPIVSSFHSVMGNAYESAMTKIPEEAGERELWYYYYYLLPQIIQKRSTPEVFHNVKDVFLKVRHKPIRSVYEREISRIKTAANLFTYITNDPLAMKESDAVKVMIEESLSLLENGDITPFIHKDQPSLAPIIYSGNIAKFTFRRIKEVDTCSNEDISYYIKARDIMVKVIALYEANPTELSDRMREEILQIKGLKQRMDEALRHIIRERCSIDIQSML